MHPGPPPQHPFPQQQAPQQQMPPHQQDMRHVPMPQQPMHGGPPPPPRRNARSKRVAAVVVRDVIQGFALIVAALWGGYTFIYKEIILPAKRPASLVVTPRLEAIGRRGDTILARATFHMVNRSDDKVYTPAIWYSVRGLKLQSVATEDSTYLRQNGEAAEKPYATARFSEYTAFDLIAAGKLAAEVETWYDPDGEQTVEQLLLIPADRYDAAQLQVQYLVTRDVRDVKAVRWRTNENGDLDPRLVFQPTSKYGTAGLLPAAMSDTSPRYVGWLRAHHGGVNFVTATMSLWRNAPPTSVPTPPAAAQ
ncbi:MAG TPA: hypothetical protein VEX86_19130 [Longimicrobium sp.]|nr:hypothetical protein [Longimicrobium sp.]